MDDVVVVQVFDAADDLVDVVTTLVFSDCFAALVQFHHRSFLAKFQHDVHIERIVEEAVEADDVLVVQTLVDLDLLCHLLLLVVFHH